MGNFQTLKQYSTKEYKFTQRKSIGLLDPAKSANADAISDVQLSTEEFEGVKSGICAVLSADWLREKLASESALFSGAFEGPDVHSGQNLATAARNVPKFLEYKQSPSTVEALSQHGLAPTHRKVGNPVVRERVEKVERMTQKKVFVSQINFANSMASACTTAFLKKGSGFYMSFRVKAKDPNKRDGGHSVAAYRSKGNTLYFFDPNCGVYKILISP